MITLKIASIVEEVCKSKNNFFGFGIWTHHILPVMKYSKIMAKKIGADEEIVEIAALIHDYAGSKDYNLYENHNLHGAKLAEEVLKNLNCPQEKIEVVKQRILSHR
jgi:uncharacterized protein